MANEFIARKGLISLDGAKITGSLGIQGSVNATGAVTASAFSGDGSNLTNIATSLVFSGSSGGSDTLNLKTDTLRFSGSNGLLATVTDNTITYGLPAGTVTASSQIDHNATTNYVANQHINHANVSMSAGLGLTGGGDLTTSRTFTLDTGSLHFERGVRAEITSSNTTGASGINLNYNQITGNISASLATSSLTVNGQAVSLGGSITVTANTTNTLTLGNGLTGTSFNGSSAVTTNVDTGSAHFTNGVKAKLNTDGVISSSIQVDHNATTNYVANQHIDHSSVSITAGAGLNGGGDISTTRTLSVNSGSMLPYYSSSIFGTVSGDILINSSGVATIQANSVALGTDTTGNYAAAVSAGNGITVGGTAGEGTTFSVTLDTGSTHFTNGVKAKLNTDGVVSSSAQIAAYGNFATTGSNTFTGVQTISNTTNSTNFTNGALIVQGGVGIAKDVNISGSLTVTGLLTAVSMSTQYVTSSAYTIGTSKIILNDDDLVRFAGISVVDSGSSQSTGSLYWDSLRNHWLYENESGSAYNSALIIAGPKHTGSLGGEVGLISGRIPVATGEDHIDTDPTLTPLRVVGTTLHAEGNVYVTGSVTASAFSGDGSQLTGIATTLQQITTNGATTTNQVTLAGGAIIHGVLYSSGSNTDVDTGTEVVATFPTGSYDAAHFDYVVKKSGNLRTGTVMVIWQSGTTNIEFTDTSTNDIGNTAEVVFTADTLSGNVRLLATVSTTDWNIKTSAKLI